MTKELSDAIWAGDMDTLERLAPCDCCCDEHTFTHCAARHWAGCKSGLPFGKERDSAQEWLKHYQTQHGWTEDQFYGTEAT